MNCLHLSKEDQYRRLQSFSFGSSSSIYDVGPYLFRPFSIGTIKKATSNFSSCFRIGLGEFGWIFIGKIKCTSNQHEKIEVAIKEYSSNFVEAKNHKGWVAELYALRTLEHPNVAKLLGYGFDYSGNEKKRYHMYEYAQNGSVKDHLTDKVHMQMSWITRLRIARDAARGLAFLHEFQCILRCFKSSIVLLDKHWNAKLSDFGLDRLAPPTRVFFTKNQDLVHYCAPEFMFGSAGFTAMGNVYSYGIFLVELITGRRADDKYGLFRRMNLYRNQLSVNCLEVIIDEGLIGKYRLDSAQKLLTVANICRMEDPKLRPKMGEVALTVNSILEEAEG